MGRPGVCEVPQVSGENRQMEETGCEVICGARTTLAEKGQAKVNEGHNKIAGHLRRHFALRVSPAFMWPSLSL